jgi:hypothetical protein
MSPLVSGTCWSPIYTRSVVSKTFCKTFGLFLVFSARAEGCCSPGRIKTRRRQGFTVCHSNAAQIIPPPPRPQLRWARPNLQVVGQAHQQGAHVPPLRQVPPRRRRWWPVRQGSCPLQLPVPAVQVPYARPQDVQCHPRGRLPLHLGPRPLARCQPPRTIP